MDVFAYLSRPQILYDGTMEFPCPSLEKIWFRSRISTPEGLAAMALVLGRRRNHSNLGLPRVEVRDDDGRIFDEASGRFTVITPALSRYLSLTRTEQSSPLLHQ